MTSTHTATRERVRSRTKDAARIARKFLGDLQALERLYEIGAPDYLRDMAHDLELGLLHACISHVRLCFFPQTSDEPVAVFHYAVTASGDLAAAPHSGRFRFDARLRDCRFTMRVTPSDSKKWSTLKASGELAIRWTSANALDMSGMVATDDGAYTAGDLALVRSAYLRRN